MEQISGGNEKAFRQLFDLYKERLFSFVFGLTHSVTETEEVVQDIFMKLWETRSKLDQIEHPSAYIYRMARNRTLDHLAKAGRQQKLVRQVWANMKESEEVTEEILEAKESRELIYEAISQLPERKKEIFRLSREEGLSLDEIAERLGISKQTVKNNLTEILKQLKTYLQQRSPVVAIAFWISYFEVLFK